MGDLPLTKRIVLGRIALAAAIAPVMFGAKNATAQGDELIPLVKVAPVYPPRALSRGDSGEVTLRFTIDVDGKTKDVEVVDSSSRLFEGPAVAALRRWRYSPPIENGVPVEKTGVHTIIRFAQERR